jgi:predicted regulator of Ras-like GTPase activity (Roadblock/LC7/MglB family)
MEGMRRKDEIAKNEEESLPETEHVTEISETDLLLEEKEDRSESAPLPSKSMEGPEPKTSMDQRTSTDILQEIRKIVGVSAVVLVARDGFIIESAGTLGNIDMDMVGASVGIVLDGAERMRHELDLEEFQGLTLESDGAMIMCTPVGDALLVVLAPDSKKLGMIRMRVKNQIPELEQLF